MVSFRILDPILTADRNAWCDVWARSPMQLPFAHPGYGDLMSPSDGKLLAVVMETNGATVLYPFILRRINEGLFHDITTPYGYGGPLQWGAEDEAGVAQQFWARFEQWACENRVVTEFVRFSLFDDVLPYPGKKSSRNLNFISALAGSEEDLWGGVHKKVRQGVRRAQRMGVTVEIDTECVRMAEFVRIYQGTMERRDSSEWYRFDEEFFASLLAALGGRAVIVAAIYEGRVVAANLLLTGTDTVYAFLGGTDEAAFAMRATEFMEFHSMNWARENGFQHYVLGGGVTPGDGLENYKERFAPQGGVFFHTGERVFDHDTVEELVAERKRAFEAAEVPWDDESEFFPLYRIPIPEDALIGTEPVC